MEEREQDFGKNQQTMNQNNLSTLVAGIYLKNVKRIKGPLFDYPIISTNVNI